MSNLLLLGLPLIGGAIGWLVSGEKKGVPIFLGCATGLFASMLIFEVFGV